MPRDQRAAMTQKSKDVEEQRLMKLLKSTFEGGFMLGCRIAGHAAHFLRQKWTQLGERSNRHLPMVSARSCRRPAGPLLIESGGDPEDWQKKGFDRSEE